MIFNSNSIIALNIYLCYLPSKTRNFHFRSTYSRSSSSQLSLILEFLAPRLNILYQLIHNRTYAVYWLYLEQFLSNFSVPLFSSSKYTHHHLNQVRSNQKEPLNSPLSFHLHRSRAPTVNQPKVLFSSYLLLMEATSMNLS